MAAGVAAALRSRVVPWHSWRAQILALGPRRGRLAHPVDHFPFLACGAAWGRAARRFGGCAIFGAAADVPALSGGSGCLVNVAQIAHRLRQRLLVALRGPDREPVGGDSGPLRGPCGLTNAA